MSPTCTIRLTKRNVSKVLRTWLEKRDGGIPRHPTQSLIGIVFLYCVDGYSTPHTLATETKFINKNAVCQWAALYHQYSLTSIWHGLKKMSYLIKLLLRLFIFGILTMSSLSLEIVPTYMIIR